MKKTLKKSLALLLVAVLFFGAAPIIGIDFSMPASAADENDLVFNLINNDTEFEIGACGWSASGDLIIPASYAGVPVTSIAELAFYDCHSLESITLPDSITNIGERAFQYCSGIKSIVIPKSLTSLGEYAFYVCRGIESVTFAEGCKLERISSSAFDTCESLKGITIPESVTTIGDYAFYGCNSLESVAFVEGSKLESIDSGAFCNCSKMENIIIPEGVTSIGSDAFFGCNSLKSVTFAQDCKLESIGDYAFNYCSKIESITIPESVTSIGSDAFYGCPSLSEIIVDQSNANYTSVDGVLFSKDGKTLIKYPEGKADTSYDIPSGVTRIVDSAFENCDSLSSITIPSSVTSIGSDAFTDSAYYNNTDNWIDGALYIGDCFIETASECTSCNIAEDTRLVADAAFYNSYDLEEINVPESNTSYSSEDGVLFSKAKDVLVCYPSSKDGTVYNIPNSVSIIAAYAFYSCDDLESLNIPSSVTSIGECAFEDSYSLFSVTFAEGIKLKSISYRQFYGCGRLESINIPEGVTSIEGKAFEDCENLTSVTIPEGVTSIGDNAFEDCENLDSVTIPESVTYIGEDAFEDCDIISDIYYGGDESDWEEVYLGPDNGEIFAAEWHYSIVVTDVALDITSKTLAVGATQQLTATVTPDNATNQVVAYTSSDTAIATVDKNGLVTAKAVGTATITVTTKNKSKTATCVISVISPTITIKNLNNSSLIKYGETLRLTAVTADMPEGAKIEWSVQGTGVMLKVSEDTLTCDVTSTASGTVTVTAKIVDADGEPITGADGNENAATQQVKSNASFFQKLISFFKNLFRISRIIVQSIDE